MSSNNANHALRSFFPVLAILFLACTLRSVQYFARTSFWSDELDLVANFEDRSITELVSGPLENMQIAPGGFLAATKASGMLLGLNEIGLRFVPWLCAVAGVVLFWNVARRVVSGLALLAGLLIFAVSPSLIWYGAAVKPYSGDVAATLLLVLLALRFEQLPGDPRRAIVAGLLGGAAVFFSYPAIVVAGVLGLALVWNWLRDRPRPSITPLLCLGAPWTASALVAGLLALKLADPSTNVYMRRFWIEGFPPAPWSSALALLWFPKHLLDSLGFLMLFLAADSTLGLILVGTCSLLALVGAIVLFRKHPRHAVLIMAPALAAIMAASLRLLPFQGRVGLWAGWPLLVLAMAGLEMIGVWVSQRSRAAGTSLPALLGGASVILTFSFALPPYRCQDTRPVLAAIAQRWHDGDILYVYYGAGPAMDFYGKRAGFKEWTTGDCHREEPRVYFREVDQFRGHPRVWFFYTHSAFGYREPAVIRSYFETIGTERERITGSSSAPGQCDAMALLYDLSDARRLAASKWDTYPLSETRTEGPRILCDGTRVSGK